MSASATQGGHNNLGIWNWSAYTLDYQGWALGWAFAWTSPLSPRPSGGIPASEAAQGE